MPLADSAGARISFTVHGPSAPGSGPEAETILLIMGLGGSGAMWWRLLGHLAPRHRVVVFDHRGTGDSTPVTRPLTISDMVGDCVAVLDAADVGEAHVVGASMGGMIAQHLALDHRDRVRSLTLACTTPGGGGRSAPNPRLLGATLLRPLIGRRRTWPLVAPALYSQATLAAGGARLAEERERRSADRVGALTTWMQMAAVAGHDTRARLSELADLPTLVIHGDEDRLIPLERGEALAAAIPGAKLLVVPGAAHILVMDAEQLVADAIVGHVDDAAPVAGERAAHA